MVHDVIYPWKAFSGQFKFCCCIPVRVYPCSSHCDRHDRPGDNILFCSFPRVVVSGEQQSFGPRPHLRTSVIVNHDMSSGFKAGFIISSLVEMLLFAVSIFGCVLPLLYPCCQLESSFIGIIIQNLRFHTGLCQHHVCAFSSAIFTIWFFVVVRAANRVL